MSTLPKPQPCGQNWLSMTPTANGRLCGQCDKEIYDFSAMSWPEIEHTQVTHGSALCGMYSAAQLAHWGQLPPSACARLASATALALALSTVQAHGQALLPAAGLTLSGTVFTITAKGEPEPIPFASIYVAGTRLGTITNAQGQYELALPDSIQRTPSILMCSSLGFKTDKFELPSQNAGLVQHNVLLTADTTNIISYSVRKPSLFERAKWTLKRWLGPPH